MVMPKLEKNIDGNIFNIDVQLWCDKLFSFVSSIQGLSLCSLT